MGKTVRKLFKSPPRYNDGQASVVMESEIDRLKRSLGIRIRDEHKWNWGLELQSSGRGRNRVKDRF